MIAAELRAGYDVLADQLQQEEEIKAGADEPEDVKVCPAVQQAWDEHKQINAEEDFQHDTGAN